jgi:hypothetical protein
MPLLEKEGNRPIQNDTSSLIGVGRAIKKKPRSVLYL